MRPASAVERWLRRLSGRTDPRAALLRQTRAVWQEWAESKTSLERAEYWTRRLMRPQGVPTGDLSTGQMGQAAAPRQSAAKGK